MGSGDYLVVDDNTSQSVAVEGNYCLVSRILYLVSHKDRSAVPPLGNSRHQLLCGDADSYLSVAEYEYSKGWSISKTKVVSKKTNSENPSPWWKILALPVLVQIGRNIERLCKKGGLSCPKRGITVPTGEFIGKRAYFRGTNYVKGGMVFWGFPSPPQP